MIAVRLVAVVASLLVAVQVVRNAVVTQFAQVRPDAAARLWPGYPSVEIGEGLVSIATASRARRPLDPLSFSLIDDAAAKAPLAAEPFLVRGVQAQMSGNTDAAARAFAAAQWRNPRSLPAAYFLAQHDLEAGQGLSGLNQVALVARLSGGSDAVAPYLAAYARNPATWQQMRALFRSQPDIAGTVLIALAKDARNTDAVLALVDQANRRPDAPWLSVLLSTLVSSGDYARAKAVWASVAGAGPAGGLIFDTNFASPGPPPPFNWSFASSNIGLAEREPGKRLHVIFYGNLEGVLASQLLTLRPGTYRLQMHFAAPPSQPSALAWSIRCDKSANPASQSSLDQVAAHGWTFQVPANCPAQWLELTGRSADVAQQSEVTISGLSLSTQGGHA